MGGGPHNFQLWKPNPASDVKRTSPGVRFTFLRKVAHKLGRWEGTTQQNPNGKRVKRPQQQHLGHNKCLQIQRCPKMLLGPLARRPQSIPWQWKSSSLKSSLGHRAHSQTQVMNSNLKNRQFCLETFYSPYSTWGLSNVPSYRDLVVHVIDRLPVLSLFLLRCPWHLTV